MKCPASSGPVASEAFQRPALDVAHPYNETRGYVERVLWHSIMFTWLAKDGEAQRTDSWLTPIKPLGHG